MKYLFALLLALSLLVGCTSAPVAPTESSEPAAVSDNIPVVKVIADIEIVSGQLIPDELRVSLNKETKLYVHNTENTTQRFEIPLYGSQVSEDIAPDDYVLVVITPKNKGSVAMELNGVQIGTIIIS